MDGSKVVTLAQELHGEGKITKAKRIGIAVQIWINIITLNEYFLSLNFRRLLSILKSIAIIVEIEIH